jgi:hypothetical protein
MAVAMQSQQLLWLHMSRMCMKWVLHKCFLFAAIEPVHYTTVRHWLELVGALQPPDAPPLRGMQEKVCGLHNRIIPLCVSLTCSASTVSGIDTRGMRPACTL